MVLPRILYLLKLGPGFGGERNGLWALDIGTTVPADGTAGYEIGAIFLKTDGTAGTTNYQNEGTTNSCAFKPVSALTAAQEALLSATAGVATALKAVILDANAHVDAVKTAALSIGASGAEVAVTSTPAELNQLDGAILADLTPGTGISAATPGVICEHRVTKVGGLFKTEILLDLTDLNSGNAANDIIGEDGGTANCHIGQITAAVNGAIIAGRVTCFETPAGGDPDVDLCTSTAATGAQDADSTALAGYAKLINHGDWTAEDIDHLDALPAADSYIYLACGDATDADYTAGILLIELWGK